MWVWAAVAAAASVYGAVKGSQAEYAAGQARSEAAMRNAKYLREQADFARQLGATRQLQYQDKANRFRSQQQGLFAKAGVDLTGSALQVIGQTSANMERDLAQIKWTTENEARFADLKASNYERAAADAVKAGAQNANLALVKGLGGVATSMAMVGKGGGTTGSSILTGMGQAAQGVGGAFSGLGTGFAAFGSYLWDASPTMNPSFTKMGTGYRG